MLLLMQFSKLSRRDGVKRTEELVEIAHAAKAALKHDVRNRQIGRLQQLRRGGEAFDCDVLRAGDAELLFEIV